jgi:aspartate racemase
VLLLSDAIACLHRAGAEFALISAGTPHIVFDDLRAISPIPLLNIIKKTLKAARGMELKRVGLFGTKFTMQSDFFQKIFSKSNIELIVPSEEEQGYIYEKLLREITLGRIIDETRAGLLKIVKRMIDQTSIEGLILGCTELPLILTKDEFGIPFLNATRIHAESAAAYSLSDNG